MKRAVLVAAMVALLSSPAAAPVVCPDAETGEMAECAGRIVQIRPLTDPEAQRDMIRQLALGYMDNTERVRELERQASALARRVNTLEDEILTLRADLATQAAIATLGR